MLHRHLVFAAVALATSVATTAFAYAQSQSKPEPEQLEIATFGAGCYWCVESDFDKVKGVLYTTPGFMGGKTPNPTYEEVSTGTTGHTEVVNVTFDPTIVTYQKLLDHYWANVDPLDRTGQFCDCLLYTSDAADE